MLRRLERYWTLSMPSSQSGEDITIIACSRRARVSAGSGSPAKVNGRHPNQDARAVALVRWVGD
jgi:hypothetical protein